MSNWKTRREDYALEVVPLEFRQWGWLSLTSVILGVSSAMFFFSFGGQLVEQFGTVNLIIAMVVATLVVGSIGYLFATFAAKVGLNMDLITSICGLGYRGAGLTSFIYSIAAVVYFAVEGNIIATAVHTYYPHIPLWSIELVTGLIFIPLTWYGMTLVNYLMWITLPIYAAILIYWIHLVAVMPATQSFLHYQPLHPLTSAAGPIVLQILAPTLATIANASLAADIGRLIPQKRRKLGVFSITFINSAICYLGATILGAWFAVKLKQTNPGIYMPQLMGFVGVFMVVISQLRINMINAYGGSLTLSTCMSRLFNIRPGRHVALIIIGCLATAALFLNLLAHLTTVFAFLSIFLVAWIAVIVAYIIFAKALSFADTHPIKYKQGEIDSFNWVGFSALLVALIVGVPMGLGLFGAIGVTYAPFVAGGIGFVLVPIFLPFRRRHLAADQL